MTAVSELSVVRPWAAAEIPPTWVRLEEQPVVAMLIDALAEVQKRVTALELCIGEC